MRQIKNIKKGHFVKYNGILCQVNCTCDGRATLVELKEAHESARLFSVPITEKVEYLGDFAIDDKGRHWITTERFRTLPFLD